MENFDVFLFKEIDNIRCEYEILKQQIAHWMPCDEPVSFIKKNIFLLLFF